MTAAAQKQAEFAMALNASECGFEQRGSSVFNMGVGDQLHLAGILDAVAPALEPSS